jgi:hypothetical protein
VVLDLLDRNLGADGLPEPFGNCAPVNRAAAADHAELGGALGLRAIHREARAVRPAVAQFTQHQAGQASKIALQRLVFQEKSDNSAHESLVAPTDFNMGEPAGQVNQQSIVFPPRKPTKSLH